MQNSYFLTVTLRSPKEFMYNLSYYEIFILFDGLIFIIYDWPNVFCILILCKGFR
jgi:hypothetical protein